MDFDLWPGWQDCGNGLWRAPDGVLGRDPPPPYPTAPLIIAVVGDEGLDWPAVCKAMTFCHRRRPMTTLLHNPPPQDGYLATRSEPSYVWLWAQHYGVPLQPLQARWWTWAMGAIDFAGRTEMPQGVRTWRPYRRR